MSSDFDYLYNVLSAAFRSDYPSEKMLFHYSKDIPQHEGNYYRDAFNDKTWKNAIENDFDLIKKTFHKAKTLGFFTAAGFAYYIPAFLLYFYQHRDGELMQPFCFRLIPGKTNESMNRQGEILNCLNESEMAAIKLSLEFLDRKWVSLGEIDNEAHGALKEFWSYV